MYSIGDPSAQMLSIQITETYSGSDYIYEPVICGFFANAGSGIQPRYIVFSNGYMSVYVSDSSKLVASTTSTRFYIYRDGSTGRLGIGWENKNASTTAIKFNARPLSNMTSQIQYQTGL